MNAPPIRPPSRDRAHLVERAVEAMGGAQPPAGARPAGLTMPVAEPVSPASPVLAPALETAGAAGSDSAAATAGRDAARRADRQADRVADAPAPLISRDQLVAAGLAIGTAAGARSRLAEEYSVVQHAVLRTIRATASIDGRCGRIVMITSARPAEGKSFTALNLATALAQASQRSVVLVDCDGKAGSLTDHFGLRDAVGLCCLAMDPSPTRHGHAALVPTAVQRLFVLPYGRTGRPGTSAPPTVGATLLRLANAYPDHLFVLDMPPCLATSDASLLAPVVGQIIMVVQAQATQRAEVEAALDLVDTCPNLQLLLNRAVLRGNDAFGAYGYDAYAAPPTDRP